MESKKQIGMIIIRIKRGITQQSLADMCGVSRTTISNIERNGIKNTPVKTLEKISEALGTNVKDLFFSEEK